MESEEARLERIHVLGRCSVHVGYCVVQVVVVMKCGEGITRAYRGANEDVAVECVV